MLTLRPLFRHRLTRLLHSHSSDLPIVSLHEHKVAIGWNTQTLSKFHNIWLRDHCRCPSCFHPITKQRLLNTFSIPPDIKPVSARPVQDGLEVVWDGHTSLYPWSWLQTMSYDPKFPQMQQKSEKTLWGAKIHQRPPMVHYDQVMSDGGLYKWLTNIDQFGFCFVSGVPATTEATEELSKRIGFIRETQYGKFWDFTSDLAKGDTAYTTLALGAHTDNTYFTDPCGLQLFHLLSHTEGSGGATLLVDGFSVAAKLKQQHPDAYDVLSRLPVPAHAAGEASSFYRPSPGCGYPVLQHDANSGDLSTVRWNNDDRSVMSPSDPAIVDQWYVRH
ncbi:hypothetical protein HGRIS_003639 [Hohenbuehelia grisea]|uniref:trimethyllysine dioxygenase n=1 Tax=Hohenbuehelia grisea TaxID=104357 RepID=A0ABR3JGZ3_9AGAR